MRQAIEDPIGAAAMDAAPSSPTDGVDLLAWQSSIQRPFRHAKYIVTIGLTGGTSLEVFVWALVNDVWGKLCDALAPTGLLGGAALGSGATYHLELERIGIATRIAFVKGTDTGGVTVSTLTVAGVLEKD